VLITLRVLAEVVGECLGRVAGERLDGVADDGQFTRGNYDIGLAGKDIPGLLTTTRMILNMARKK
jgi:hypothetical protein